MMSLELYKRKAGVSVSDHKVAWKIGYSKGSTCCVVSETCIEYYPLGCKITKRITSLVSQLTQNVYQ
jgi:hypothetical protein